MKKFLQLLFFLLIPFIAYNQTGTVVNYVDNLGPLTFNYNGLFNGKHSYQGIDPSPPTYTLTLRWTGSTWAIYTRVGAGADVLSFTSPVNTVINPPNFTIGMWVDADLGDGISLLGLSGSGTTSMPLPVELVEFGAIKSGKSILLNWMTASEVNNIGFDIERSTDGRNWRMIGFENSVGTTNETQNYKFIDTHPMLGLNYYRLKQIDFDGQFEYSKVISVTFKGENGEIGEFYPNPSKSGLVSFDYNSQSDEEITVSVFDMRGKLLINQIQQLSIGGNNLSFEFSNLNTGIYIVNIGDQRNQTYRKLIIEK